MSVDPKWKLRPVMVYAHCGMKIRVHVWHLDTLTLLWLRPFFGRVSLSTYHSRMELGSRCPSSVRNRTNSPCLLTFFSYKTLALLRTAILFYSSHSFAFVLFARYCVFEQISTKLRRCIRLRCWVMLSLSCSSFSARL